jgi:thioredoxin-related protein
MLKTLRQKILFAAGFVSAVFGAHADQVVWRADIGTAMAEARANAKIVMVDVYTDWCGWCTKLDEETYSDPEVATLLSGLVAVKINPEKGGAGAKFVEPYKITGYPNILFLDSEGKLLDRIDGFLNASAFAKRLAAIYARHGVAAVKPAAPSPVRTGTRLPHDLFSTPPTANLIKENLSGFPFDASVPAGLDEARAILRYLGASRLSFDRPDLGCVSAVFAKGVELTIWPGSYGKPGVYGFRFGVPDARRNYFGSNDSYFEVFKSYSAEIVWLRDIDAALSRAKSQGKIVMVDVFADWCGWCTKLDEETYSDKVVIDLARDFVNLKIDGDDKAASGAFTRKYHVDGYPTILFLDSDGSVVNRIGGYVDAAEFTRQIRRTSENRDKLKAYSAESAKGDHRNAQAFISLLLESGRADEAIPLFDRLSGGSVFSSDVRTELSLDLASSLIDSNEYAKALSYISMVERMSPSGSSLHRARYYRSIISYYTEGKAAALSYLDGLIASASTPEDWRGSYRKLRAQIEKTK